MSAGGAHTCALLAGGDVACWGRNADGQLGIGSTESVGGEPGQLGSALHLVDLGGKHPATRVEGAGKRQEWVRGDEGFG